ncbi:uncharacterized protein LOC121602389 [Anopheles merus]|uniref:uncharacterized protein LOC121602389 n=1 Tax=Anopheles merus TaxID=30066 RepID=UPI001BE4E097|nr:uncharacterized protein LOC121602389 [Anopheles merus]
MTKLEYPENERERALENVDKMLFTIASELPTLLGEVCSVSNALKDTKLCNFSSLCAVTSELPPSIATELRIAHEAADSKQFFLCTKGIADASDRLTTLMAEAKQTRRKLDQFLAINTAAAEQQQQLQRSCIYLDQALGLLFALDLELHEIKLAASALYLHGQKAGAAQLRETEGLKGAVARLVAFSRQSTSPQPWLR